MWATERQLCHEIEALIVHSGGFRRAIILRAWRNAGQECSCSNGQNKASCARGDTICPRYTPHAAAHLQSIAYTPYDCGAQRALLPIAVGAMNINELMNINDVRESATLFPRPASWPFAFESGVRVTCDLGYLCASFGLPRPSLFSSYSRCMRQTDVRQKHRLMPPP